MTKKEYKRLLIEVLNTYKGINNESANYLLEHNFTMLKGKGKGIKAILVSYMAGKIYAIIQNPDSTALLLIPSFITDISAIAIVNIIDKYDKKVLSTQNVANKSALEMQKLEIAIDFLNGLNKKEEEKYLSYKM